MTLLPVLKPVMKYNLSSPLAGGGGGVPEWQPSDLYTGSADGAFVDFTTIETMLQADQVTPVSASGQLIGKIADLSGKDNHFIAVATHEPQYIVTSGFGYGYFGASKWLERLIPKPANYTIVTAMRSNIGHVAASGNSGGGSASMWGQCSVAIDGKYNWSFGDGTLYSYGATTAPLMAPSGEDIVVAQTYLSGSNKPIIYDGSLAPAATSQSGTATSTGGINYKYSLGRPGEFSSAWTGRLYGYCIINRVLTAPELAAVYAYFQARVP